MVCVAGEGDTIASEAASRPPQNVHAHTSATAITIKIIVCGDFNDSPVSYTHHRIASCGLTDAFVAAGNGLGRSFNRDAIVVRIDNILHSKHWKAYRCEVDDSNKDSDHYPIACYLKRLKGQ